LKSRRIAKAGGPVGVDADGPTQWRKDRAFRRVTATPLSFLSVATILTVIGAGIAGSALTYALTWLRESRRTKDSNRAPQRAAIAEIVEATYELTLRVFAFRDACEERARQSEDKTFRRVSDAELEELTKQAQRALFGVGRAFHIGRMTVVDADCYEAMAAAFNNFSKLQGALEGVA
jgi:hypothetical protein